MTATLPTETIVDDEYVHSIHITNNTGDFEVAWHRDNADEVKAAKAAFMQARKDGMLTYRTDRHGNKAEQITSWDPAAEKIVATRQFQGG